MPNHLYVALPNDTSVGAVLPLDRDRHHYVTRVLRHTSGDRLTCFDGRGLGFDAKLTADRSSATLEVIAVRARKPPPERRNHLALAVLKGAAMDRAIQLACESGADDISLFNAARSNVKLDSSRYAKKVVHWRKILIGACEQSGRLFLPGFEPNASLPELVARHTNAYALHMEGGPFNFQMGADRLLLIGPEGGWSDEELSAFDSARVQRVSVGPTTLRAESTPGAAMAILSYLDRSI